MVGYSALDSMASATADEQPARLSPMAGDQSQDDCELEASKLDDQMDQSADSMELPDETQLRRILNCKRLSEGCNRFSASGPPVCRKNSLHMNAGEQLQPVTEGEMMKQPANTSSSSASSASLRSRNFANSKRNSQDDTTASCSSSTSLDGPLGRSPGRRRSSTASQCSSVLSEGTRQQLHFDLSPDLAPDSSLFEANACSPSEDPERPASPEPSSLSGDGSLDFRPISRISTYDELMFPLSTPESPACDCAEASRQSHAANCPSARQLHCCESGAGCESPPASRPFGSLEPLNSDEANEHLESTGREPSWRRPTSEQEAPAHNLERLIADVSEVKVSAESAAVEEQWRSRNSSQQSNKRAHTPYEFKVQRNKPTPVPAAAAAAAARADLRD